MHKLGKLTNEELDGLILSRIKHTRPEVVIRPHIGEDCAALDLNGRLCVLSSDPITAAEKGAGRIAVNVACNDIASAGARPIGLMVTLLLPPDIERKEIIEVADDICEAAGGIGCGYNRRAYGGYRRGKLDCDFLYRYRLSYRPHDSYRRSVGGG